MQRTPRTLPLMFAIGLAFSMPALAADNAAKDAPAGTKATQETKADAKEQTKVSEADARKKALSSVPNSAVQSSKMVTDKGRQLWAFDLKSESSPTVFVVQVDANSGRIVSKSVKTAAPAAKAKKS
jgi:uncharacterized membrane protein YkoI